jgi:hypothetical protein
MLAEPLVVRDDELAQLQKNPPATSQSGFKKPPFCLDLLHARKLTKSAWIR